MHRPSRRRFLLAAGGAVVLASGCACGPKQDLAVLEAQLRALIASGHFSAVVGGKYLETAGLPSDSAFSTLQAEVMKELGKQKGDLLSKIRQLVEQDFANGRICLLDGWALSATECRLAGLAFLFEQAGGHIEAPTVGTDNPTSGRAEASIAEVKDWGPRFGTVGEGFNQQPNGTSALWFRFADLDQHSYQIYFGANPLRTNVRGDRNLITATITQGQVRLSLASPGEVPVYLVDMLKGSKQLVGHFRVQPPAGMAKPQADP